MLSLTATQAPAANASPTLRAVAAAGLALGVLDALDGVAYFGITQGLNPIQVLQFIASGALGHAAYQGGLWRGFGGLPQREGLATAGLGALLHFAIAFVAAGVYVAAYRASSLVRTQWVPVALAYGVAVWAFMNLVVVPMSAIGQMPTLAGAIHGVVGHALTVGLTAAIATRRVLGRETHRAS